MERNRLIWPVTFGIAVCLFLLLTKGRFLQTGSYDLVQHYLLVDEIMKYGGVRPPPLPMGLMAYYPAFSHRAAALIGWIGGSGLVGIILITIACTYACYVLILSTFRSTAAALVMLLAFGALARTLSLVGWEIELNFFYPQMVGNVVYFGMLLLASRCENVTRRQLWFLGAGLFAMWIQPLIAVHILALGCMLAFAHVIEGWCDRKSIFFRGGGMLLVGAASLAIIVLHPAFQAMRTISANDGALRFGYEDPLPIALLCAALGAVSLYRRKDRISRVLGFAAITAASLAVIQYVVLKTGFGGSLYAVKKHMFIVFTVGVMNAVRIVTAWISDDRAAALRPWLIPMAAGAMALAALHNFTQPIIPAIRAVAFAEQAVDYSLPGFRPGNTVYEDPNATMLVNQLVSLAPFKHAFDKHAIAWPGYEERVSTEAKFVMTGRAHGIGDTCDKTLMQGEQFEIVDVSCLYNYRAGDLIDFRAGGNSWRYVIAGIGQPESWGRWGFEHVRMRLSLKPEASKKYRLEVDGRGWIVEKHPTQPIDVLINGKKIATWVYDFRFPAGAVSADIPAEAMKDGEILVEFMAPGALSPIDIGASKDDARKFGLGLQSMKIVAGEASSKSR